jgi:hypothetical protein
VQTVSSKLDDGKEEMVYGRTSRKTRKPFEIFSIDHLASSHDV